MSKELLAIDIDEVLFPFLDRFIAYHNSEYSTKYRKEDFKSYDFSTVLGGSILDTVDRVYEIQHKIEQDPVEPIKQSKEALAALRSKFDLSVITARHPKFEPTTSSWLNKHYGKVIKSVSYIGNAAVMKEPRTKAEVCQEIGAVCLIDDSLNHIIECSEVGIKGIIFGEYPWNQTDQMPVNTVRCPDWPAVLREFSI